MELSNLVLEEVSAGIFQEWKEIWYGKFQNFETNTMFTSIKNPVNYQSYRQAIDDFFDHPDSQSLSVFDCRSREGSKWKRLFKSKKMRDPEDFEDEIKYFAKIADSQPLERKRRAFFEMKFGEYGANHTDEMLVIGFTELENKQVVGTYMNFPISCSHMLNMPNSDFSTYDKVKAVWIPE